MKLETLLKKRDDLEKQIAQAQKDEARKESIFALAQKAKILHLPDDVLLAAFAEIARENPSRPA